MTAQPAPRHELRAAFARQLSRMYALEVPAYQTLVDVCLDINREAVTSGSYEGGVGSIGRITEERHGAIRVGGPAELRDIARLFALLGMEPVGFYDLREAAARSVPVVSTAFRPVDGDDLDRNAFRVFTSMLVPADRRFFDAATQRALEDHVAARDLLSPALRDAMATAEAHGGVPRHAVDEFVALAVRPFELDRDPLDAAWYDHLAEVSSVAADIGAEPGTHINHLTPRVLDIDELYRRMEARGITMIDRIQGPPRTPAPLVLLRQTSFRALDEVRAMRQLDGTVVDRPLRVRFGEVEARGTALTPAGRQRYDDLLAAADAALRETPDATYQQLAEPLFIDGLPADDIGLARDRLAYHHYAAARPWTDDASPTFDDLLDGGHLEVSPIVYEDFLPRSAAGIFQSNLTSDGSRRDDEHGTHQDAGTLADAMDREVLDPYALYAAQQQRSLDTALRALGLSPDAVADRPDAAGAR